jgi:hypothetical protein
MIVAVPTRLCVNVSTILTKESKLPDNKLGELAKELRFKFPWIPTGQDVILARAVAVMIVESNIALLNSLSRTDCDYGFEDILKELNAQKSELEREA